MGWLVSAAVIPWEAIERLTEPNDSPRWEEARSSLSVGLCRGTNLGFQAIQIWAEGTRPSHDGQSLGKEFAERRVEVSMAASQLSVIGRESQVDFFCVSLNLLINSGKQGSSARHIFIVANMEKMSAHLIPPLFVASRSRISLGETQV